ncbi:MAG: PEP-CTERM sorting domain-containing protein [Desulfovibrionales bacterium]|nr:PEP-CTERM sorting domain-containing protein [Desulfovibrionales bacterium]
MRKVVLLVIVAIMLGVPGVGFSYSFSDDFNDGNLEGWTIKQGDWFNPGDHLLSSYDNYGIIWKDDSFGVDQFLQVDAYFDDGTTSKTAQLRLRSGDAGWGPNPYFDHGYFAGVSDSSVYIYNAVAPYDQRFLGSATINLQDNSWHTLAFSVVGLGNDTNLKLWVNDVLYLDVYDTTGAQHDDGGYVALGSSNHLNPQIQYDNVSGSVDVTPVPEPATMLLLSSGLISMAGIKRKFRKR